MESIIVQRLRIVTSKRTSLLSNITARLPQGLIENKYTVHSVLVVTVLALIISTFAVTRRLNLFSLHPVFMAIGCIICFGEGLVSYKNHFLVDALSPIMQHNKVTKLRAIHQTCQCLGALFMLLGLIIILAHKFDKEKTIIPHTLHSLTGTLCILMVAVQAVIGSLKMDQLLTSHRRVYRWHGDSGLLLWDLVCLTVVLGVISFFPYSLLTVIVLLMPLLAWAVVHIQLQVYDKQHDEDRRTGSMDEGDPLTSAETGKSGLYLDTDAINNDDTEDGENDVETSDDAGDL